MFDSLKSALHAGFKPSGLLSDDWESARSYYEKYGRLLARIQGKPIPGSSFCDWYFKERLDAHMVVMVGLGKHVRGNLCSILDVLNHSRDYAAFQIYVRTSEETDAAVNAMIRENGWIRTKTLPDSDRYRQILEQAKYLITEVYFPSGWLKKPGQVLISLWHGTPIKKLGQSKNAKNSHKSGPQQKNFIYADYQLCPNAYTMEKLLDSYQVSDLMHAQLVMLGYPRTGGMLSAPDEKRTALREQLAPEGEKIYVYMPTFRDTFKKGEEVALYRELFDYLDANLSDEECLYVNLHHKAGASVDYSAYQRIRPFPQDVDSYELLAASDALVSDYSSVIFDYLPLRRQIVLYIPDYEFYEEKRGMYLDLMSLPFDKAKTKEEVLTFLRQGKQYDDSAALARFCPYDSADNAAKLCRLLLDDSSGLNLRQIPESGTAKVLIHSEEMPIGEQTALLQTLAKEHDPAAYRIYFSCDVKLVPHKSGAYPMLNENPVIGSENDAHLTNLGTAVKEQYLQGRFSFKKAMRYLSYEYALSAQRMFAGAAFSLIVLYDCTDADRILSLACCGADLILCLQEETLEKISAGDRFLSDAVSYAATKSRAIFTFSEKACDLARKLLSDVTELHPAVLTDYEMLDKEIKREI